jgi:hypothetical protein
LIAEVCAKIKGVGPSKGYALAEYLDGDWNAFLAADTDHILGFRKAGDKSIFTVEQISELVDLKKEFLDFSDIRSAWIYLIGKNFLLAQMQTLQSITLSNLDINPFLMKVLNFKTPKDVLEFNLYQAVTRSIVTSWGSTVEVLLFRCGAEKFIEKNKGARAGRRPDLEKSIDGRKYYVQVKSGPNTMNVDMVNSLNEVIEEYKTREPDATFLLGMTYGTKGRISAQIRGNLHNFDDSVLIGRELWDFVSEEVNFHKEIFTILDQSSKNITAKTFSDHLKDQLVVLVDEWKAKFGDKTIDEAYENYI